jgi:hypothetical protein
MKKLKLNMKYYEQKKRFVILVLIMFLLIVVAIKLLQFAYASYESTAKLNANIDKAIYLLEAEGLSFNIDPDKIVPSNDAYIYKFSVSNFNENKHSDIDIEYSINITTTTNLPLTYEIYRNENYDDENATNLFQNATIKQDVDGAWYNVLEGEEKYLFPYTEDMTDIYTLVIHFDESHKQNTDAYADNLESIEVEINSNQVTE